MSILLRLSKRASWRQEVPRERCVHKAVSDSVATHWTRYRGLQTRLHRALHTHRVVSVDHSTLRGCVTGADVHIGFRRGRVQNPLLHRLTTHANDERSSALQHHRLKKRSADQRELVVRVGSQNSRSCSWRTCPQAVVGRGPATRRVQSAAVISTRCFCRVSA